MNKLQQQNKLFKKNNEYLQQQIIESNKNYKVSDVYLINILYIKWKLFCLIYVYRAKSVV